MEIQAFGYLGVGTAHLDDWTGLATKGLGMEAVDRGGNSRAFRMDDRKQRLVLDGAVPGGTNYFGWEVADAAALETLAARLEQAGVAVQREPAALADHGWFAIAATHTRRRPNRGENTRRKRPPPLRSPSSCRSGGPRSFRPTRERAV